MLRLSIIITLLLASPVRAEFYSGNDLHERCRGSAVDSISCRAYIAAVSDVMQRNTVASWTACMSENVTLGQVTDVVTRWLANNPEKRQYAANSLTAYALSEAFPC